MDKKSDEREERRKKKRLVLTLCAANPRSRSATISSFFKSLARFSFFSRRRSVLVASVTSRDEVIIFGDDADILYSRFLLKKGARHARVDDAPPRSSFVALRDDGNARTYQLDDDDAMKERITRRRASPPARGSL